jgi:hypothetical protein
MTHRTPPRLATWLLQRLGFPRRKPAFTGDLLEEFHSGRSRAWYWRQTAIVIARDICCLALSAGPLAFATLVFAFLTLLDYVFWRLHLEREDAWLITALVVLIPTGVFALDRWRPARSKFGEGVRVILLLSSLLLSRLLITWTHEGPLRARITHDFELAALTWLGFTVALLIRSGRRHAHRRG